MWSREEGSTVFTYSAVDQKSHRYFLKAYCVSGILVAVKNKIIKEKDKVLPSKEEF